MANPSHCLPTGALQTAELPTCNITDGTTTRFTPVGGIGSGTIRGVVVFLTGFDVFTNTGTGIPPFLPPDTTGTFFTSFKNELVADGWIFLMVPSNEWFYHGFGSQGVFNAINADPGFGSNYLQGTMHWWTHIILYIKAKYPAGIPVVVFGDSWGAFQTLQVASAQQSTLLAAGCHCPPTLLGGVNHLFTPPINFGSTNTTGLNLSTNALASVNIPMIVGFGTNDEAVGYSGSSTVASGFSTTAAAAVTTIPVNSITGFLSTGPQITVLTTGGLGYACYSIGSISSNNLNGLTYLSGSGNVAVGTAVIQSSLQQVLAAAPANVVPNSTSDTHEFTLTDAMFYSGTWFVNTVDPLAPAKF